LRAGDRNIISFGLISPLAMMLPFG
jgi:hypothetical protein